MGTKDPILGISLYVGDLHPQVTEEDLFDTFHRVGPLFSLHLCRDKVSHKSRGYGYVNFWFACHAYSAMECLNYTVLKGKTMRIMLQHQRNRVIRKDNDGNLFVKNLDRSISSARLHQIFSQYGRILSCKVAEEEGISKGFGFVQFESEYSAMAAISVVHNSMLEGKRIYVSKFRSKAERMKVEAGFTSVYVRNLDEDVTEDLLKYKFSECGNVSSVVILKDNNMESRRFGFVNFDSPDAAKQAIESLNGQLLGSKNLFVGRALRKAERMEDETSNLYVLNLNASVDDRKLEGLFRSYGTVISARIFRDSSGISKGYGFVRFSSPLDAKKALHCLAGSYFEGRPLYVTFARHKEQQAAKFLEPYAKLPQPHCALNANVPPTPYWNFNSLDFLVPVQQMDSWNPLSYEAAIPFTLPIPFQAQSFANAFYPYWMELTAPNIDTREGNAGSKKGQKQLISLENKSIVGHAKENDQQALPVVRQLNSASTAEPVLYAATGNKLLGSA